MFATVFLCFIAGECYGSVNICICNDISLSVTYFCPSCRYMGIGLSAQGVNMNRLPGKLQLCHYNNDSIKVKQRLVNEKARIGYIIHVPEKDFVELIKLHDDQ